MTNNDPIAGPDNRFTRRYDVDFQTRKCLHQLDYYDEYVLDASGKITLTEITSDGTEKDPRPIGHLNVRLVQMGRCINDGASLFELFDSFDQYFHDIYGQLFDPGIDTFTETICRQFKDLGSSSNILLIDEVELLPPFRGERIGLAAVHRAIDVWGPSDCLVIIPLYPAQFYDRRDDADWKKKMQPDTFVQDEEAARSKLQRYWGILGFERIWDNRFICALCTNNQHPSMQDICPDF
jgi:hypothetical protein